ncbi:acetylglutamate kinase [Cytobacillus oceanisediminis]|uniref:Acetylglutamate kinase n=1 Tax=Niallia alba TaxID=2729105 RepID=A0A7Y0K747_9BACI|nr:MULTISPECIES: acetylglutamate kinase [Bacillaceae]MBZ9533123.1 acetylglutamate kinase [Cytobacillus oceanisediminis]MDU1845443.1 acetylglutamate kinase [Niallia nealsonii]MED3792166.1 acetylglutamate kinase [Niallia alba]NMO76753.1 acetylglutamate kinase [Niallia alba]
MKTIVIKCGGSVIDQLTPEFFTSLKMLKNNGYQLVFIHGGGPDINEMLDHFQVKATFHNGLRKTTKEALEIVEMVLSGKTNRKLVQLLREHDLSGIGLNGTDDNCISASLIDEEKLGLVGAVSEVNIRLISSLLEKNLIPVITPLGITEDGRKLNINADYVASAVAKYLHAEQCLFVTDVAGILINGEFQSVMEQEEINHFIEVGQISGGMIPKVTSAIAALESGLNSVMIVSGKKQFFDGQELLGTRIVVKEGIVE